MTPKVCAMVVGFLKGGDFLEFDCPWCGHEHIAYVSANLKTPFILPVPCGQYQIIISSTAPVFVNEEE
jgi:hypothetical protein